MMMLRLLLLIKIYGSFWISQSCTVVGIQFAIFWTTGHNQKYSTFVGYLLSATKPPSSSSHRLILNPIYCGPRITRVCGVCRAGEGIISKAEHNAWLCKSWERSFGSNHRIEVIVVSRTSKLRCAVSRERGVLLGD